MHKEFKEREKKKVYVCRYLFNRSWRKGKFAGVCALKTQLSVINWTFFPRIQILIFLREATQNDHIRLLYKFENDQKNFGCVGSCGYAPASVKYNLCHLWFSCQYPLINYPDSKGKLPTFLLWPQGVTFNLQCGLLVSSPPLYSMGWIYLWRSILIFFVTDVAHFWALADSSCMYQKLCQSPTSLL